MAERISGATVSPDLFGAGKDGFTEGVPGTTAATVVTDDWLNSQQEEIANAVELSGQVLDSTVSTQLDQAISMAAMRLAVVNHVARSPSGFSGTGLFSVCETDNGTVIAVGDVAQIQRSTTLGVGWAAITAGGGYTGDLNHVSAMGSAVLAVGGGIQWSDDYGATFANKTPAGGATDFRAGAWGWDGTDERYVIVGSAGKIQTAETNLSMLTPPNTWVARTAAGGFAGYFYGLAYGETGPSFHRWVAVGASGTIQTSDNGITWTARTADAGFVGTFLSVIWDGSQYIACGVTGTIQTSPDGVTWTARTTTTTQTLYSVALVVIDSGDDNVTDSDSLWVAVGTNGAIQVSADSKSWISCRRTRYDTALYGVANWAVGSATYNSVVTMVGEGGIIRQSLVL